MIQRFGSREICDVTFKALTSGTKVGNRTFNAGQPVFVIDTATTSNFEQASTTVYAQGGKGYNRLIAWEGEKTLTFTVTDALMSPMGLAVLTGAGFGEEAEVKHIHVTYDTIATVGAVSDNDKALSGSISHAQLASELGVSTDNEILICVDSNIKSYATLLDGNGAIKDWTQEVKFGNTSSVDSVKISKGSTLAFSTKIAKDSVGDTGSTVTLKLDFYVLLSTDGTQITIGPDDFGGYFYVEADTLYRNQDGKDMAATLTFPKVKIQSGFTMTMAANGDPSTFDFVMDAFPAYTYFDKTKKVVLDMVIAGGGEVESNTISHKSAAKETHTVTS